MDLEQCLIERQSIRLYTPQILEDAEIISLLDKAIWAPSGKNIQPWKMQILEKEDLIKISKFKKKVAGLEGQIME